MNRRTVERTSVCAVHVWFDDRERLWVRLADGRELATPLEQMPFLARAKAAQRRDWTLADDGTDIHWPQLDEYVSVRAMFGLSD
ncbi:MAG: DUF2442 domain-containing protein [Chloroflexota bacterium]